ncbi:ABC transporter ATP-binding protein [Catenulispora sp. NF23]|uniref:ABC transporter ATP-binding protein n=1 Tax=Catenulispora pinistramenti TaxID=2705254 RepID=UPI001BABE112|nr:ABC transporter ATP-binding protein [Catenulispora pinistramenti]MBS2532183.1 ABC transporter ATP-binding protein [Catenulispora pinistramenti]
MNTLLDIKGLTVAMAGLGRPILDEVSLAVHDGEAVALVGESGSGKSVTARTALGLFPGGATVSGSVVVGGTEVVAAGPGDLRRVRTSVASMIFQDPRAGVNPVRRIGDFLTEPLRRIQGRSKAEATAQALELLGAVGLPDPPRHLRQFPHELSGGMLQRVMIAYALTADPRLLLCDEPTTALDVTTQAEIMAILGRLRRDRGLGILLITHDLDLAASVCDRVYVMYAGRIMEAAPSAALTSVPRHPYTRGLLGSAPPLTGPMPRLAPIPGAPLGLAEAVSGCPFAARCAHVVPGLCDATTPTLERHGDSQVACLRAAELIDETQGEGLR